MRYQDYGLVAEAVADEADFRTRVRELIDRYAVPEPPEELYGSRDGRVQLLQLLAAEVFAVTAVGTGERFGGQVVDAAQSLGLAGGLAFVAGLLDPRLVPVVLVIALAAQGWTRLAVWCAHDRSTPLHERAVRGREFLAWVAGEHPVGKSLLWAPIFRLLRTARPGYRSAYEERVVAESQAVRRSSCLRGSVWVAPWEYGLWRQRYAEWFDRVLADRHVAALKQARFGMTTAARKTACLEHCRCLIPTPTGPHADVPSAACSCGHPIPSEPWVLM